MTALATSFCSMLFPRCDCPLSRKSSTSSIRSVERDTAQTESLETRTKTSDWRNKFFVFSHQRLHVLAEGLSELCPVLSSTQCHVRESMNYLLQYRTQILCQHWSGMCPFLEENRRWVDSIVNIYPPSIPRWNLLQPTDINTPRITSLFLQCFFFSLILVSICFILYTRILYSEYSCLQQHPPIREDGYEWGVYNLGNSST